MTEDLYETLGVSRDATADEIHEAYRRQAKKTHPDAGGSAEAFTAVVGDGAKGAATQVHAIWWASGDEAEIDTGIIETWRRKSRWDAGTLTYSRGDKTGTVLELVNEWAAENGKEPLDEGSQ